MTKRLVTAIGAGVLFAVVVPATSAQVVGQDAATLNRAYLEGRRIDLAPIFALADTRAPHHEMEIRFEP